MYAPASDQFVYIVGEVHERCYRSDHSIPQKKPEGGFHCKRGMLHGRGASTLFFLRLLTHRGALYYY